MGARFVALGQRKSNLHDTDDQNTAAGVARRVFYLPSMSVCATRTPWFWLATAVIAGVLLFAGGLATWNLTVVPNFTRWELSQLPPSFPVYPSAQITGVSIVATDCTYVEVHWQTTSPAADVLTFYQERMARAPWQSVETSEPGTVAFLGSGRDEVFGRVQVAAGGPPTRFRYLGQRPYDASGHRRPVCLTPNPRQRLASLS